MRFAPILLCVTALASGVSAQPVSKPTKATRAAKTPEEAVRAYVAALKRGDMNAAVATVNPRDVAAFKASFVALGKQAWTAKEFGKLRKLIFPRYPTLESFEHAPAAAVVASFMEVAFKKNAEAMKPFKQGTVALRGRIDAGPDVAYILWAITGSGMELVDGYTNRMTTLRTKQGAWTVVLTNSSGRSMQALIEMVAKQSKLQTPAWTGSTLTRSLSPLPKTLKDPLEKVYVDGLRTWVRRDWKQLAARMHPSALATLKKRVWASIQKHAKTRKGYEKALAEKYPAFTSLEATRRLSPQVFFVAIAKSLLEDVTPKSLDAYRCAFVGKYFKGEEAWLLVEESLAGDRSLSLIPFKQHEGRWRILLDSEWAQLIVMLDLTLGFLGDEPDED